MNHTIEKDISLILNDLNIPWNEFRCASFFITGATGLLGSLVTKTLLAYKQQEQCDLSLYIQVRSLERAREIYGDDLEQVELVIGDVRDKITLAQSVDYIVHCASVTASKYMVSNPVETISIAVKGTENVLNLAIEKQIKSMIYLSSMEVYGTTLEEQNPVTEDQLGYVDLTKPRSSYPEGKRICEVMCNAYHAQYGVPVKSVRLAQTFGAGIPLSDNRVSMQFARSVINGENIVLHTAGKSVSNFCYTTDAVRGLLTILMKGQNGQAYNVCNDHESRTIAEIAELVADKVAGGNISVEFDIPKDNVYGYAPDAVMRLSAEKLKGLGWRADIDMEHGYLHLIAYLTEC